MWGWGYCCTMSNLLWKYLIQIHYALVSSMINPQRMHCRIMVVVFCVCMCVSVCLLPRTKSATYLVYMSKRRCCGVLHGVFKIFVVWLSLKLLRSKVLAWFANHHCLPHFLTSSQWTKETPMASFQCKEYIQLTIALAPTTRLTHHWSIILH